MRRIPGLDTGYQLDNLVAEFTKFVLLDGQRACSAEYRLIRREIRDLWWRYRGVSWVSLSRGVKHLDSTLRGADDTAINILDSTHGAVKMFFFEKNQESILMLPIPQFGPEFGTLQNPEGTDSVGALKRSAELQ
jgi:hypothetical protein